MVCGIIPILKVDVYSYSGVDVYSYSGALVDVYSYSGALMVCPYVSVDVLYINQETTTSFQGRSYRLSMDLS